MCIMLRYLRVLLSTIRSYVANLKMHDQMCLKLELYGLVHEEEDERGLYANERDLCAIILLRGPIEMGQMES